MRNYGTSNLIGIKRMHQLFKTPRTSIEKEFSPYFHRYFSRFFKNPKKFDGYIELCSFLFHVTKAKNASVLDLGCGFGMMANLFGLFGAKEVIGYDLNTEKIDLFRKLLLYLDPEVGNVRPVLGDSSKIEFSDEYFDVVVTNEALSHVREMEHTIEETYRILKPGGRLLVRDGNNSLFLWGWVRRRMFWRRVEQGPIDPTAFRSTDVPLPFIQIRQRMILEKFPQMGKKKVQILSQETAGMFGDEIFEAVEKFEKTGRIPDRPKFRYRNPMTGEFPEREINPIRLKVMLREKGFETVFIPYSYTTSFNDAEMMVKRLFYMIGRYLSIFHLFLTPGFAILGVKGSKPR
jgi:ubiquinone/menaquinone biosynthesis C-methylase UbiE